MWPTFAPLAEALALLPAGVYQAGTSRCRWCALTAPLHPCLCGGHGPLPSAVCFCGTVLTVSRTGRYPAGLAIGEPGLSSTGSAGPIGESFAGASPTNKPKGCGRSRSPHLLSIGNFSLALADLPVARQARVQGFPTVHSCLFPQKLGLSSRLRLTESGVVAQPDRATVS